MIKVSTKQSADVIDNAKDWSHGLVLISDLLVKGLNGEGQPSSERGITNIFS